MARRGLTKFQMNKKLTEMANELSYRLGGNRGQRPRPGPRYAPQPDPWMFKNALYVPDPNTYGFVYLCEYPNGMAYIGRCRIRQHWKNYCGSGTEVLEYLALHGKKDIKRTVLSEHPTRIMMLAAERDAIRNAEAVEDPMFYNMVP